jgi:hypothetical protein
MALWQYVQMPEAPLSIWQRAIALSALATTVAVSVGVAALTSMIFPALPTWCLVIVGILALPISFWAVGWFSRTVIGVIRRRRHTASMSEDARKMWLRAGATLAMADAMGVQMSTAPDSDERIALRLDHCMAERRTKYPDLSKNEACDIMFEVMKTWARATVRLG